MKRFTDTLKWEAPWFRQLSPNAKLFWFFITDRCDASGAWEVDYEAFTFYSQASVPNTLDPKQIVNHILEEFQGRIVWINKETLFIIKFIQFQYGELREECKPHTQAWKSLEKYGLVEDYHKGFQSLSIDYPKTTDSVKDKDKDKNKEEDKDKVKKEREIIDSIVELYHINLPKLRKVKGIGSQRKRLVRGAIRRCRKGEHYSDIRDVFLAVSRSAFLQGANDSGWQADFDWILTAKNWDKIMEGKYEPTENPKNKVLKDDDHKDGF